MTDNEEAVERLRAEFAAAASKLTPEIEPAFAYAWREMKPADPVADDAN